MDQPTERTDAGSDPTDDGATARYHFDGRGNVERLDEQFAVGEGATKGFQLIIGSLGSPQFRYWLRGEIGAAEANALAVPSARTRCQIMEDKVLIVLRVARPGAVPEDIGRQLMGIWLESGRVIMATDVNIPELMGFPLSGKAGFAPHSAADLVARLTVRISERLEPLIETLADRLDRVEEMGMRHQKGDGRARLAAIRHNLISFRRLLWPQRDILNTLEIENLSFVSRKDRQRLREASARTARLGDELQALSERAVLVHEHILDQRAEQTNKAMLILATVTTVFMPLTLITGLLGMNVQGIPFSESLWAFWIVVGALVAMGALQIVWFKRRGWF